MKQLILIQIIIFLFLFIPFLSHGQSSVPDEYWLDDSNFEKAIEGNHAFGDDDDMPIVIEFWAKFNDVNCFADWKKIENAKYYRVDISKAPLAKKEYRIRMAPTLLIFKGGEKEATFKAGLDLLLPTDLKEIQETINEINTANKF